MAKITINLGQNSHVYRDHHNLVYCCHPCNFKKGAKTPEEAGMPIIYVEESKVAR